MIYTRSGQREDDHTCAVRVVPEPLRVEARIGVGDQGSRPGRDGDVLLSANGVADDPAAVPGSVVEAPEILTGLGVVRVDASFHVTEEDQLPSGRQEAPEWRHRIIYRPLQRAGHGLAGVEVPVRRAVRRSLEVEVRADVQLGVRLGDRRRPHDLEVHAAFLNDLVPEAGLRVVRPRVPAVGAGDPRAGPGTHLYT